MTTLGLPTRDECIQRAEDAMRRHVRGSDPSLYPNNLAVVTKMVGEMGYQALQYAEHLSRDRFVSTAAGPGLDKRAADEGVQRLPARYAEGQVDVTGNPFAAVPVGVQFQRADGARYTVMTAATLDAAGTASVYVRAEVIGAAGNAPVGVVLTMTASVDGVSPAGRVSTAGVSGGASVETDENLRQRVLFSIRNPPSGGNTADYVRWARAALQTVTRVWVDPVTPENQRNSVGVWVAMDETYETGVPLASDLDIVRAYIDALRPAGALVNVAAPRPVAVSPIVQLSPDTAAVRSAVDAELAAFFAREGQVSTTVSPASVFRSRLVEAISGTAGEHHHQLIEPTGDIALAVGEMAIYGNVQFRGANV